MTRFMREISGLLDKEVAERTGEPNRHYWYNHATEEAYKAVEKFKKDAQVDDNGIVTWKSNGRCPMDDFLEMLDWAGVATINYEATRKERDRQNEESIREYKESMKNHVYSEEELFEMRAAFGRGTTIVDVITGQTIRL